MAHRKSVTVFIKFKNQKHRKKTLAKSVQKPFSLSQVPKYKN